MNLQFTNLGCKMAADRIARIEWAALEGTRPRNAGCNARLGEHGSRINMPIVRLTSTDGATGFGISWAKADLLERLVNEPLDALWSDSAGVLPAGAAIDFPLLDLIGRLRGKPVYALACAITGREKPEALKAPCYDTSLYFDDLHLGSTEEAAQLIAAQAEEGLTRGHRNFKIKVGRGARHLPLEEGTVRDIAIIRAVRDAAGPDAALMIDANNGYNLNLAKRVLEETADCNLFWLEEPFHEDPVLYRDLKAWMKVKGLDVLIADGEGEASKNLLAWANEGLVDVIQYDIYGHGFTRWLETGKRLDEQSIRSAPHHYGSHYGNYAACHLAAALKSFTFVEWDEATTPGLDASRYSIEAGYVHVPELSGFGLSLDESVFRKAKENGGGEVKL